jgi:hypothetical protein
VAAVATSVDGSEATFDDLVEHVEGCDGSTDAAGFTTAVEPLPSPAVGDEARAFRIESSNDTGARVSLVLGMARTDEALLLTANIVSIGAPDPETVTAALQAMIGRAS